MVNIPQGQNQGLPADFMQRFKQFREQMTGDPRAQIQQLMNSGRISQAQYNFAYQTATQLMNMFGSK